MSQKANKQRPRKSTGHISTAQKERLLDLVKERPQLRSGKFTKNFTLKDGQNEWEVIAEILNAIPGSNKTWRLWRKSWQDLQSKAKSKKAIFNKAFKKTGGGPPPDPVDEFEERVVALINNNSVVGHGGVTESIVEFVEVEESSIEVPDLLPPPPEFDDQLEMEVPDIQPPPQFESHEDNQEQPEPEYPEIPEQGTSGQKKCTKKINMKTLLKEKLELKKKFVDSTIKLQEQFIKIQEERNIILKDLVNKFK